MGCCRRFEMPGGVSRIRAMKSAETILTWCSAGVLIAALVLIPYSLQKNDAPRRKRTVAGGIHQWTEARQDAEERVVGRGRAGEVTVVRPEMPKPLFVGSGIPQDYSPPNLQMSNVPPVREVTIPRAVSLLSRGVAVTSSDPAPLGELSLITDGEKNGDDGYYVDILPLSQWVQLDLGETREIWLLWLWMYHKMAVIYKDVIIEVANDPEFSDARIIFNNDYDNTSGMGIGKDESWIETNHGHAIRTNGVRGRYVRLYSNGRSCDDTNQWIEVEVYGRRTSNGTVPDDGDMFISPPPAGFEPVPQSE